MPLADRVLLLTARLPDVEGMRAALEHGANLAAVDSILGESALHHAASSKYVTGREEALELLLERGVDVLARAPVAGDYTALHVACEVHTTPRAVRMLVEAGIPVDARDDDGCTPLHCCPLYLGPGAAPELLRLGADVNARNCVGRTPLHEATRTVVMSNVPAIIGLCGVLLEAGANPLAVDEDGRTPLANVQEWPFLVSKMLPYVWRGLRVDRSDSI